MARRRMSEDDRLRWIRRREAATRGKASRSAGDRRFPIGIGDDAALWTPSPGMSAVLTVDVQVEGVHFRREWISARDLGWRAVASSASDLAAMGARPACILVSLTLENSGADLEAIQEGILESARAHGLRLIGGNLSAGPLTVSVTAIGETRPADALTRGGAREGDEIWVTGEPGLARLGLRLLERGARARLPAGAARALRAFRRPRARLEEAIEIASRWRPRAMIDLSDGIALDLRRVLEESSRGRKRPLGAALDEEALASPAVARLARALGEDPVETALRGGEDYELLFTAPPRREGARAAAFEKRFGIPITRIGTITRGGGLAVRTRGGTTRPVTEKGWDHWDDGLPEPPESVEEHDGRDDMEECEERKERRMPTKVRREKRQHREGERHRHADGPGPRAASRVPVDPRPRDPSFGGRGVAPHVDHRPVEEDAGADHSRHRRNEAGNDHPLLDL